MSIRSRIARLFRHTGFILALAVVVGLTFHQPASWTRPAVTPGLGLIMTFSLLSISPRIFLDFKKLLPPIAISLFMNYVVLSGTLIGLSSLFIQDHELWTGFVLVAAVPPAVAVIPYTHHLKGNTTFSLVGAVASYLAALIITPVISVSFLGTNFIDPQRLLLTLSSLIIAPLLVSQILRRTRIIATLEKYRSPIVNWTFFLVVYTIIGLNRNAFLEQPLTVLRLSAVAFGSTFVLAYLINRIARLLRVNRQTRVSLMLLGTRKNYGLSAAIALTFFNARAAMPTAIAMAFAIFQFIFLTLWLKKTD